MNTSEVSDLARAAVGIRLADLDLAIDATPYGAARLTMVSRRGKLEVVVTRDSATGVRLEQFAPEHAGEDLPALLIQGLRSLLPWLGWRYVVGLYPVAWHQELGSFGFVRQCERLRMRVVLDATYTAPALKRAEVTRPVRSSAEQLGRLLWNSEGGVVSQSRCVALCGSILGGEFGPVIEKASREVVINGSVVGACIFSLYHGRPLLSHLFLDRLHQGKGLATLVLSECLAALAGAGHPAADLSTDLDNTKAIAAYEKVGFRRVLPYLTCGWLSLPAGGSGDGNT